MPDSFEDPDPALAPLASRSSLSRRRALGLLGAVGVGLISIPSADLLRPHLTRFLADRWPRRLVPAPLSASSISLPDPEHYEAFLRSQNFHMIQVKKILAAHAKSRSGVANTFPPPRLWQQLLPTLRVAEAIGEQLNEKVKGVISAYRSPQYNSMCPGSARNSQHLRNNALDLVFPSPPRRVAEVARALRAAGLFRGGIGVYRGFTHIDTRGRNSDWGI